MRQNPQPTRQCFFDSMWRDPSPPETCVVASCTGGRGLRRIIWRLKNDVPQRWSCRFGLSRPATKIWRLIYGCAILLQFICWRLRQLVSVTESRMTEGSMMKNDYDRRHRIEYIGLWTVVRTICLLYDMIWWWCAVLKSWRVASLIYCK